MARSIKKGPYIQEKLLRKIAKLRIGDRTIIKTWCRACVISPQMVGFTFGVHNGKDFIPIFITEDMVGHRLGEFAPTRKFVRHGGKMQRELEQKAVQATTEAAKGQPTQA